MHVSHDLSAGHSRAGHYGQRAELALRRWDSDGSGTISSSEAQSAEPRSRIAENFARIDADSDGSLTRDEIRADFKTYRKDGTLRGEERPSRPEPSGSEGGAGGPPSVVPPPPAATAQSLFEALVIAADTDGDIRLSRDELAANPLANLLQPEFGRIDSDADGLLSSREVDAFETALNTPAPEQPAPLPESETGTTPEPEAEPPSGSAGEAYSAGPAATYATREAADLFAGLFSAMRTDTASDNITISREAGRSYLQLLAAIA